MWSTQASKLLQENETSFDKWKATVAALFKKISSARIGGLHKQDFDTPLRQQVRLGLSASYCKNYFLANN